MIRATALKMLINLDPRGGAAGRVFAFLPVILPVTREFGLAFLG
jgi:hypothetical protein